MPTRAPPRLMKTASRLGQGRTSGGFGALTDNLKWVVDPETLPGERHPSEGGDFQGRQDLKAFRVRLQAPNFRDFALRTSIILR